MKLCHYPAARETMDPKLVPSCHMRLAVLASDRIVLSGLRFSNLLRHGVLTEEVFVQEQ